MNSTAYQRQVAGLEFEDRMKARARRRGVPYIAPVPNLPAPYEERIERRRRRYRLREIWKAVLGTDCSVCCQASRNDGIICADGECDIQNGIRSG